MSFNALEQSTELGAPIRVYVFELERTDASGNLVVERRVGYTSANDDVTLNTGSLNLPCLAVPIEDDNAKYSGDKQADTMTITASSEIEPASWFTALPPSIPANVTIYDLHDGDAGFAVTYVGEIMSASFGEPGRVKFSVYPIGASMDREGLRMCWQRTCPHTIYDKSTCKLNEDLFAVPFTVSSVIGFVVVTEGLATQPVGRFNGGFLAFEHPVKGAMKLTIESSAGEMLTMFEGADELYPGLTGFVYPGCNHTRDACRAFNNYLNFGGVPSLPGKSPFDGNPVF